ncbi:GGDEF domain-containing protein [Halomonas halodenitrificans]|uniref:GGDEF domain-containing protein n=1 Tax=Halomonas halodenitrificans TaxID=28252 RepID=UPI00146FBF07|nr:GGDEF domain-containing protein [Halomonas halodenitrificans]
MPQSDDENSTFAPRRHQPAPPFAMPRTGGELRANLTSVRDTFSNRHHSLDFAYSHAHYLRNRVLAVGVIFVLLTPLWALVDATMLPAELLCMILLARGGLLAGLLGVLLLAKTSREKIGRIRVSAGMLLALPAVFYAVILILLPSGETRQLTGYAFIPFLLVAALSIFPFTILESLGAGIAMLSLLALAQMVDGSWLTPEGLEGVWLLASLLVVSLSSNHFQLSLLMRVYRQATHDPLTGLLNRGALTLHLDKLQAWRLQQQVDGGLPACAILMMDIDHFKQINDTHGHSVGDRVLTEFAQILIEQTRPEDSVARYGGEEFIVLLLNADPVQASRVAERIRNAVDQHHFTDHELQRVPLTTSVGVASLRNREAPQAALKRADDALYYAKQSGRNCVMTLDTAPPIPEWATRSPSLV